MIAPDGDCDKKGSHSCPIACICDHVDRVAKYERFRQKKIQTFCAASVFVIFSILDGEIS